MGAKDYHDENYDDYTGDDDDDDYNYEEPYFDEYDAGEVHVYNFTTR